MKKTILTIIGLALLASACGTNTNTIPAQTNQMPNGIVTNPIVTNPATTIPTVGTQSNMSVLYTNISGNYGGKIGSNGVDSTISITRDKVTFTSSVATFTVDYDLTSSFSNRDQFSKFAIPFFVLKNQQILKTYFNQSSIEI